MNTISRDEAVQVLVNAVRVATTKGAYTLEDTKVINQAVDALNVPEKKDEDK